MGAVRGVNEAWIAGFEGGVGVVVGIRGWKHPEGGVWGGGEIEEVEETGLER